MSRSYRPLRTIAAGSQPDVLTGCRSWGLVVAPSRRESAGVSGKRFFVALAVVSALGWLFAATQASRGKNCHFTVHFAKRVVCTKSER